MPSIEEYHAYGLASILNELESSTACVRYAWLTNYSPRQPPPPCLLELWRSFLDECCIIPHVQIYLLIFSMPRRVTDCIAWSGRHTLY
ncbi:hypothetical protein TNCV_884691 [Trichonephila clavipes]|nr:hypothetical protein TNCV_884691 [Trichonephila clavipes]